MSFNLAAYVLQHAQSRADHTALDLLGTQQWTYEQLQQATRGTATGLLRRGLVPGDRVLMRLGNTPDFPICYLGAITAGLIPIPISAQLTEPEVAQIISETRPACVVLDDDLAMPVTQVPMVSLAELRAMADLPPAAYAMVDPESAAYIIYTSGTSGQPRAVVHAHRAILARQMMFDGWYGLRASDRVLHAGAFNWTYTLGAGLMDPWTIGATALIPPAGTAATQLPGLIAKHQASIFAASPGVYRRILRSEMPVMSHLRHGISAGEKLAEPTRTAWEAATGTAIHEAFGMSECSTFLSGSPDRPAPSGSLGFPQPGRQVRLMEDGQIAIHRDDPGLMLGYLDQPAETAAKFSDDWFLTGDIGTMDPSGAIHYAGRVDDMMNAGGVRVSPVEVENALGLHPAIEEVAAVEVRISADLSLIAVFYVSPNLIDETALVAHCAAHLADYKCPRIFQKIDALPRGANNKILRKRLRHTYEADHGQT